MIKCVIYRMLDGQILRNVMCPSDHVALQCNEGEEFFLNCPFGATHIINNEPVTIIPEPIPPTDAEIIAALIKAMENHYDDVARTRNYDNRLTCALRAGLVGSPFQAEGLAFGVWMDNCNAYGYQVMADCKAALRTIPTPSELVAELPPMVWP